MDRLWPPLPLPALIGNNLGMETPIVESQTGVTLVGAGPVSRTALALALRHAPRLVAADGGANRLVRLGHLPEAVIGDLDSILPATRARLEGRLHLVAEQDSTDFDKALRAIKAPFVLGLGFWGARMDHGLAALAGLVRRADQPCILLGGGDAVFVAPRDLTLDLPLCTRVSLFPMGRMRGISEGLLWPIDAVEFAPDRQIGTSNEVNARPVRLKFDAAKMLVIVPQAQLLRVLRAFGGPTDVHGE